MNLQKRRGGLLLLLVIVLCLLQFSAAAALAGSWRLDAPADQMLPRNLRLSAAALLAESPTEPGSLAALRISGSAQPSQAGMDGLYQRLRAETPGPIYLVDLREESHGFFAGAAISWHEEHNWGNRGRTIRAAQDDEQQRLSALQGTIEAVPLGREDSARLEAQELQAPAALSEEAAAVRAGFRYVRFTATDQCWPEVAVVDDFLRFYQALPPQPVWLHFHCQAGHGRTTSFMVLYDILRNPQLPLESIVLRQHLLGGTDLLAEAAGQDWLAVENRRKAKFLRLFYRYVQAEQAQGFALSWSEWLAQPQLENS